MNLEELVEKYPNDMELGAAVRELYWQKRKPMDILTEKMKGKKIFESPDGGKTIYVREFGQDVSERTLLEDRNQLNLFGNE